MWQTNGHTVASVEIMPVALAPSQARQAKRVIERQSLDKRADWTGRMTRWGRRPFAKGEIFWWSNNRKTTWLHQKNNALSWVINFNSLWKKICSRMTVVLSFWENNVDLYSYRHVHYSRVRNKCTALNKHRGTLINFWGFFQGLCIPASRVVDMPVRI